MQPDETDDGTRSSTRRQALRATLAGAAAVTVGSGSAAAKGCDVTEEDRRRVREKWADESRLVESFSRQRELIDALRENDLVEGRDDAVLVYAQVVDCEVVPEYRVLRETPDGGHLTVSFLAVGGSGYAIQNPWDPDYPCQPVWGSCPTYCHTDSCCGSCYIGLCGCEGAQVPCDPYCCWTCDCACDDFMCAHHCPPDDPVVVDAEEAWFEKAF